MAVNKNEELFKRWLGEYKQLIFKVVKTYGCSPQDQDDLFQEILLQLWSSIPGFRGKAKETTWIYRVAVNTALVWNRGQVRRQKKHNKITAIKLNEGIQQQDCEPAETQQITERLYEAIRSLPKIDGSIVLMYLDGLSYDDIAEVLGISQNNVGVKLNRAKKSSLNY